MKIIDLHVHSTASDGTYTPSEVVLLAKKTGLSAMALTDHDTTDGIPEAMTCADECKLTFVPGIELSTSYNGKEIHIVGLFIDHHSRELSDTLFLLNRTRDTRNEQIACRFRNLGIPVSMEDITAEFPGSVITRAHFASYLYKKGYVTSIKSAFDQYLSDHGPCFVKRERIPCNFTIDLIHKAGGLAILAHPVLYHLSDKNLSTMVRDLKEMGLDGIEAIYSTYSQNDERLIRRLARDNNLKISGGSDFHGSNKPHIKLGIGHGNLNVPYDVLTELKKGLQP